MQPPRPHKQKTSSSSPFLKRINDPPPATTSPHPITSNVSTQSLKIDCQYLASHQSLTAGLYAPLPLQCSRPVSIGPPPPPPPPPPRPVIHMQPRSRARKKRSTSVDSALAAGGCTPLPRILFDIEHRSSTN
ncbi:hypothetical protein B0T18DRAFT_140714 [Schizothecium vesticola]|uniref:Uncharacterized protein n=1 Tax=Schizothecium vesticola TaxID=314040 RepID=A0AA40K4U6_9PEZI|nr:hypothetical protein B0T18DRAFT_140714 [Schizothecium vesticola]